MKWKLITITLLIAFFNTYSQNTEIADVQWGTSSKVKRGLAYRGVIGYEGENMIAIMSNMSIKETKQVYFPSSKYTIVKVDSKLRTIKEEEVKLKVEKYRSDLKKIIQLGDDIYFFLSYENTKTDKQVLVAKKLNKSTLVPQPEGKVLAEVDFNSSSWDRTEFHVEISDDSSKVLVYNKVLSEDKEANEFILSVYNKDLNELWSEKIELPYDPDLYQVESVKLDNSGNAHVLGKLYDSKNWMGKAKGKKNGKVNYGFKLLSFYQRGKIKKEYNIELKDKFLNNLTIRFDENENILCAGFYSEEEEVNVKGIYFLRVDSKTKKVEVKSYEDFIVQHLKEISSEKGQKRIDRKIAKGKNIELDNFYIDHMMVKNDGSILLVAEEFYATQTYEPGMNGGSTTRTEYNFGNILLVNIDPEGNINWTDHIFKLKTGFFYSSYDMASVNGKVFFIYNTACDRLDAGQEESPKLLFSNNQCAALIEYDTDGNKTEHILYRSKEVDMMLVPNGCQQISENEMMISNYLGRKAALARIKFQNDNRSERSNSPNQ
ncbi:hypothetical protein [Mangrovivirga cuniculi]|uniref:Uncharacterized protein n=1 Tax=Mangrovivirga cuniculi TaxID=2715131 RepID=A0A4D7K512_9BACT|nr:hypothetical protein [Mangrovivirga cuniculi]QCK14478.1 hypothetical protein DCC35_06855 [Mangrovivirga cuniculi]